jgi:hypothetical protein
MWQPLGSGMTDVICYHSAHGIKSVLRGPINGSGINEAQEASNLEIKTAHVPRCRSLWPWGGEKKNANKAKPVLQGDIPGAIVAGGVVESK